MVLVAVITVNVPSVLKIISDTLQSFNDFSEFLLVVRGRLIFHFPTTAVGYSSSETASTKLAVTV